MANEFGIIDNALNKTTYLGMQFIPPIALTALILLIITRNTNKWKVLALPVLLGLTVCGINQNWILILASATMFVLESLGTDIINMFIPKR